MKLAILLPGYLDSPDYLHFRIFEKRLNVLGYRVIRLDPCGLWRTGDINNYTITNYLKDISEVINSHKNRNPEEIILIGHSLGGFVSIIAGSKFPEVTKIVALCPPASYEKYLSKWKGQEYRYSKRDLPENPQEFKKFQVPSTFVLDAQKYSAIDEISRINKPLMIFIGQEDTVVRPEVTEQLVTIANNPYVVREQGMGHSFRQSEDESNKVMDRIEKFLEE